MALALRSFRAVQRHVVAAGVCSRTYGTEPGSGKIYELRRYGIKPGKITEIIRLGTEKYEELIMPHGKLIGYWVTNTGALSEVQHLWEYDSYAHRDEVLNAKMTDKRAYDEFLSHALACLDSQSHLIMKALPWYTPKLELPQKWGVYELVIQKVKPAMMSQLEHRLIQGLPARLTEDYPQPLAMWRSEFGNIDLFVSLWPHESFDKRDEHRTQVLQHNQEWMETSRDCAKFVDKINVQGLTPVPWSPLK